MHILGKKITLACKEREADDDEPDTQIGGGGAGNGGSGAGFGGSSGGRSGVGGGSSGSGSFGDPTPIISKALLCFNDKY
ncbi:hypothetical protein RYX36_002218, partial [Vicia faba]